MDTEARRVDRTGGPTQAVVGPVPARRRQRRGRWVLDDRPHGWPRGRHLL